MALAYQQLNEEKIAHDEHTLRELLHYTNVYVLRDFFRSNPKRIDDRIVLMRDYWFYYITSFDFVIYDTNIKKALMDFYNIWVPIIDEGAKYYHQSANPYYYVLAENSNVLNADERAFLERIRKKLHSMSEAFSVFISLVKEKYVINFNDIDSGLTNDRGEEIEANKDAEESIDKKLLDLINTQTVVEVAKVQPNYLSEVYCIVKNICRQYAHLVQDRCLSNLLWRLNRKPDETDWQLLFDAVADTYQLAGGKNIAIAREEHSGAGNMDFRITRGNQASIVVEIKRVSSQNLYQGYEKQLTKYKKASRSERGIYVVIIDKDNCIDKIQKLEKMRTKCLREEKYASDIFYVYGVEQESASKKADFPENLKEYIKSW